MSRRVLLVIPMGTGVLLAACAELGVQSTRNPYLSYTDAYGVATQSTADEQQGGAVGLAQQVPFRRDLTLTFRNNHSGAELNVKFLAWVSVASVRSADQQDALLAGGFTQLTREYQFGSTHTLPVGTFVYDGGGPAGATTLFLGPGSAGEGGAVAPTTQAFTMITPDAIVAYWQPTVSCDSVAFFYSADRQPLTSVGLGDAAGPYAGADGAGAFKTIRQVDVYECEPLRPGVFLSQGGVRQPNEFFEADNVTFDFNSNASDQGDFAIVTFSAGSSSSGQSGTTGGGT